MQCLVDMLPFTVKLGVTIAFFAFLRYLVGIDVDGTDYPHMTFPSQQFIQTYRNSIGDIAPPDYAFWSDMRLEHPHIAYFGCAGAWFIWFMNQFIVLIMLLNFLIAIISQSYDNVMG